MGDDEIRVSEHEHARNRGPRVDEIPWTLGPVPRAEDVDPIDVYALPHDELLGFAYDLQLELGSVRALLSEALTLVVKQHDDLKRSTRIIGYQREQIRALSREAAA